METLPQGSRDRSNVRDRAVNPNMVILARKSRGLTQKALATALGVTQGRISKIEAGLLDVPDDVLDSLARTLNYPLHFFTQSGQLMGVGVAELFHRKHQSAPEKVLDKIYSIIDIQTRHVGALLQAAEIANEVPHIDPDDYGGCVEEVARLVRARWNMPPGPVQDLTQTMEDHGIVIVLSDFQTRHVDGITRWGPGLPPVVFVNAEKPKDRYRSTLAHELGHMVMHSEPTPDMEDEANLFAGEFLLPERDVRGDLVDLSLPRLAQLKRYWKVSMNMLLKRAQDLGLLTANQERYLWSQMSGAKYRLREPVELDVEGEQPSLLNELLDAHRNELGYTTADLGSLLRLNDDDLYKYYLHQQEARPTLRIVEATHHL